MARRTAAATTRRGVIRGLGVRPSVRIELDVRPMFDFLISACQGCGELDELLPEDRRWLENARAALPAELLAESSGAGYLTELGRLALRHPEIRTARELVAAVAKLSDRELLEELLAELLETAEFGAVARRAIDGDGAAAAELRTLLERHKDAHVSEIDLAALPGVVRRVLDCWLEPFETIEPRVARIIERDVAARRRTDIESDPLGFVEQATNGIRLVPEARLQRIVLAPSYFTRPYNMMTTGVDTDLICYPIADQALDAADRLAPPAAMLRLYKALGDETRLRVLRLLTERDWYLTELANALELSKPTMKHHLAQLRSAGLVTLIEEGSLTYYSLRRDRIRETGVELSAFLAR